MGKGIIARTMADLLAQAKDPAEAARIQRAIDAGRNQILYHGTHTDFPATDPSKVDLGLHVGTSEQATNRLADLYKRQDPNASRGSNKFTEGAQIMPLAVRPGKSLEMADVGDWDDSVQTALALRSHPEMAKHRELIDELLDSVDYLRAANMATVEHSADRAKSWINSDDNKRALQEMNALLVGEGYGSVKYLNAAENTHGTAGAILPEYAEQLNEFRSAADDLRKLAGERKKQAAHAAITNRETAEQLLKYPKSPLGYLMPEERELFDKYASQISDIEMDPIYRSDPNSYIILNPYDQRSINAQFDPEFDLSPDLMKAEGGLVGLAEKYADGGLVDLARKYNKGGLIQKYQKGNLVRQWLKGYPEKSLAPLRLKNPGAGTGDPAKTIAQLQQKLAAEPDSIVPDAFTRSLEVLAPRAALNNWIDTSLAKYIKRDYGSPNDPLAALAPEQRHVPLLDEGRMRDSQTNAVWPPQERGMIGSKLPYVSAYTPGYLQGPDIRHARQGSWVDQIITDNPWMASLAPDDELYENVSTEMLGLPHLRDELYNALRPDTDLPDMLRLKPESLPRVSVAQASQLVGKINAWRAANKAKADLAASMNPATFIHKEYPEQNMRWVQLRTPEELPPGWSQVKSGDYKSPEGELTSRHPSYGDLEKALKYEGDTMGHCVGGYCDSVFDGTSNIYSLRDARGEPHVTVEVSNNPEMYENLSRPSIVQIKGKGNNKPIDKYLPFVQDFVKSQKWGDIGDFGNTGLIKRDYAGKYLEPVGITTDESLRRSVAYGKALKAGKLPEMFSPQEFEDILKLHNPDEAEFAAYNAHMDHLFGKHTPGMKEGGKVKDKNVLDKFLDSIRTGAAGFATQYTPDERGHIGLASSMLALPELSDLVSAGSAPEWSRIASQDYDEHLNNMLARYGLPDSQNLPAMDKYMLAAGEMLGQLPIPGKLFGTAIKQAPRLAKGVIGGVGTLLDYFGPTVSPSAAVYGIGTGIGGTLRNSGDIAGGMMSLAERYGLGSDVPIDADESDRLLASLGIDSAGRKIDNAGIDRYIAESEAREAARDRIAAKVYGSLPRYGKGQLFKNVEKAVKGNGRSTIKGAERKAYPGIYRDPKELVTEASLQIPSESPALQQLFGVSRGDLADMALAREATEWLPPGAPSRGRGSAHAAPVMHDANTERLVNALNAAKGTDLGIGMQGWYMMDPAYQRLEVLYGPDEAKMMYDKLNTLTGIHSANSSVLTELNRGTAANWLDSEGRLGDYINYGGSMGAEGRPDDMAGVVGHMAHKTAHLLPAIRYLLSGVLSKEAKTPSYIAASQLAGMGNNVNFPVGDAHFSRAIGLADTRPGDTADIYGKSWSMPEAMQLHKWFTKDVAGEAGMQGVPAQATLWGVYAPQTGVKTSIGVPKLELLADMIMKTAKRLDVSPERARDLVLSGRAHAGFVDPELLGLMGLGGVGAAAAIGMKGDEDAKAIGGLVEKYGKGGIVGKVAKAVKGKRFPAAGTHEQAPGAGSGHLQDLLSAPYEERLAFQMDPRSSWLDEQGRDRLYMAAGLPTQPSNRMVGAYTPAGGTLEINPGEVARPMVRMDANGILPEDLEKMEAAELVRAITDAQNAGGYHAIIPDELAGLDERTSVAIPMRGNPTPEQMSRIAALADRNGMFATDTGSGINMINAPWTDIGAARTGTQLKDALTGQMGRDISEEMGGQRSWQHKIVAGQQSIQDELARPGQGLVTRRLLDKLDANQDLMRALEPEMRTKSYWNMMRDKERAATTGSIMRDDIQRARKIIAEGGYDGLRAALEAGVILPAAVMGVLLPILNQQDSQQDGLEVSN